MSQMPPQPMMPPQPKSANVMGILSLIAGVPGLCVPGLGLVAVLFGALGMGKAKDPRVGGKGLAVAGLVLGIVGTVFSLLMVSILLPSLNRARETANRIKCQSNLSIIGKAVLLYTNENGGAYPPDLAILAKTQDVDTIHFVCPSSSDTAAADHSQIHAGGHCSYVYVGKGRTLRSFSSTNVVAYEASDHHRGEGMNVVFEDGRSEFVDHAEAERIRAQFGK